MPVEALPLKQMLLFGGLSLIFPLGLAFLWELRVRRVSDGQVLEQASQLPVIGQIASLPVRRRKNSQSSADLLLFEESIDSLRTSLTLSDSMQDMQVLTVTSAASQEGKTSVASQLAVSIARSTGETTLLIGRRHAISGYPQRVRRRVGTGPSRTSCPAIAHSKKRSLMIGMRAFTCLPPDVCRRIRTS